MSRAEIIEHFKALAPQEQAQVAKVFVENDHSWKRLRDREGMAAVEKDRQVDLEVALRRPYRSDQ
jgi:hypothetical protein